MVKDNKVFEIWLLLIGLFLLLTTKVAIADTFTLDPVESLTRTTPITLSGTKAAGSSVYLYGEIEIVPGDNETTWSYQHDLNEGSNYIDLTSYGLYPGIPIIQTTIVLDTTPPQVYSVSPYLNGNPQRIEILFYTNDLDSETSFASATVTHESGGVIDGNWSGYTGYITFVPAAPLAPGSYTLNISLTDMVGNVEPLSFSFTYIPKPPQVTELTVDAADVGDVAKLNWSTYDESAHVEAIAGYRVYASSQPFTYGSINGVNPAATVPGGTQSYTLSGLTKGQQYYFAVVAYDVNDAYNNQVISKVAIPTDIIAPEEASRLRVAFSYTEDIVTVIWDHSANTRGDLAGYKLYFHQDNGRLVDASGNTYNYSGLTDATVYPLRVTAVDDDGNESPGATLDVVSLLDNPATVTATAGKGMVELTWTPANSSEYVKKYAIYASQTAFSTVSGMTPVLLVESDKNNATVTGLTNNTNYYFGVTTINVSDGERKQITTSPNATPTSDTEGPSISNLRLSGTALSEGATITESGLLTADLSDESGVSRVEFIVDGTPFSTDINSNDGFSAQLDISTITDGPYTLSIAAYDVLDNETILNVGINVSLALPEAPIISLPADGTSTNQPDVTVSGTAPHNTEVLIYLDSVQVAGPIAVDVAGNFYTTVYLSDGINAITVAAQNRSGSGAVSAPVNVTLDSSIPATPLGLSATSQSEGRVLLTWNTSADEHVVGYDIYRSSQPITDISHATKANSQLVEINRFSDLPFEEGLFYYRIVAVNNVGTASQPSNEANAVADSIRPRAVSIEFVPSGPFDTVSGRMAAGQVNVQVEVNEPLLTTPFLTLTPNAGVPIPVSLAKVSDTSYTGSFEILDTTPSGTAYAVFSARDLIGNRGDEIDQGASIIIDTEGPAIVQLSVNPTSPIKTNQNDPTTVNIDFSLDQEVKEGTIPEIAYQLSGAGHQLTSIDNVVQIDTLNWHGSFQLSADAGLSEAETLHFEFMAIDDLDTVSHRIEVQNDYQVYQGDLPPLEIPQNLRATGQPGGNIQLEWDTVEDAVEYQLYRQASGEAVLTAYVRVTNTTFMDESLQEGEYSYSIASVRQANAQESLSGQSSPVTALSDSQSPSVPEGLTLELVGAGIKALWSPPSNSTEELTYNLYRATGIQLTDVTGLTPIQTSIVADSSDVLGYIDTETNENESVYAVTAVDAVGNESPPSTSAYLNVDLLPVATLTVRQVDGGYPQVTWSHNGSTVAGYNIYLADNPTPLNETLLTATSYSDNGYTGDGRRYTLTAVDTNSVESLGRIVELPLVTATLQSDSSVKRGIMNRLVYDVQNLSSSAISGLKLIVEIDEHEHVTAVFDLEAGQTKPVEITVGGFASIPDLASLETTISITAEMGELVEIIQTDEIVVGESTLLLKLENQELTRGTAGMVRFKLENTSEIVTEIITAQGNSDSPEISVLLKDTDDNVLAVTPFKQQVGVGVIALPTGETVARIQPNEQFTSDWVSLPIPESAPDDVKIVLQIGKFHYKVGEQEHVEINGITTRQAVSLTDTAYSATITSVTPQSSFGDQPITISGEAIERTAQQLLAYVPVKLVISANGFERQIEATTNASGQYQYEFNPLAEESGIFTVSAIHPDVIARPGQGSFTVSRIVISPRTLNLHLAKNYEDTINIINARAGEGTAATNLRLVYDSADQPQGEYPLGLTLTPAAPINLSAEQTASLSFTISADNSVDPVGNIILRVVSEETGVDPIAVINLEYQFSEAEPALYFTPNFVETGVAHDASINESVILENKGLADLTDVTVSLLTDTESPAPNWIYLMSAGNQGTLVIGEKREIQMNISPTNLVADGIYPFKMRVESANHPTTDINVYVAVTQSGVGNVLFKASDIYTATLDANGQPIPGLAGARIRLQNEDVLNIEQTQTTDNVGEALFSDLPAGRYRLRASAPNHEDLSGRLTIKPGITTAKEIFLDFDLITIEWSVTEFTIEDKYEITLQATFETDVPAAVVVLEPTSTVLPDMTPGEVFFGELRLTNYGLIRADNLQIEYPSTDSYYRYEFLSALPETLQAKESILIPYRITALSSLEPDGAGSGGGCISYRNEVRTGYGYVCANGELSGGVTTHTWTVPVSVSGCGTSGGGGTPHHWWYSGGGTTSSGKSEYESLPSARCIPDPDCTDGCCRSGGPAGNGGGG